MNRLSLHQLSLLLARTQVAKRKDLTNACNTEISFFFEVFFFYQKVQVEVETQPSLDPESALGFKKYMH